MRIVRCEVNFDTLKEFLRLPPNVTIKQITKGTNRDTFDIYLESERFKDIPLNGFLKAEPILMYNIESPFVLSIGDYKFKRVIIEEIKENENER